MYRICMDTGKSKKRFKALAMLEMVIALVFIAILMAVMLPQFRRLSDNWDVREAGAQSLQNGMVLIDMLNRDLKRAARITAVSDPSEDFGYIEFENTEGAVIRCQLGQDSFVKYGPVGDSSDLAGPFTKLRFTCYGLQDMDTHTTDVGSIRFVRIEAVAPPQTKDSADRVITGQVYIPANRSVDILP